MSINDCTVRITITGRVQGVGFRAFVEREARERNLKGWVRNCRDGAVEAAFSGPSDSVGEMLAACRRGPDYARVDDVNVELAIEATQPGEAFVVLPTV